jgi:hypothetical protein
MPDLLPGFIIFFTPPALAASGLPTLTVFLTVTFMIVVFLHTNIIKSKLNESTPLQLHEVLEGRT